MDFSGGLKDYLVPSHRNDFRPYLLRRAWLLVFLALILSAEAFFVAGLITQEGREPAAVIESKVIEFTNEARMRESATLLSHSEVLTRAAQAKVEDMARKGYFSHQGPDGKAPWEWISEMGYVYERAGENLAVRFEDSRDVVDAWMQSPSHRANLLKNSYTEIGVGVAEGVYEGVPATYVVQFFATPRETFAVAPVEGVPLEEVSQEVSSQAAPTVAAAQTSVNPTPQGVHTLERFFARLLAEPEGTVNLLLSGTVALILVALVFAFFFQIQIQHGRMLMSGASVALVALALLVANNQVVLLQEKTMSAGVPYALPSGEVIVNELGYWISYEE